MKSTLEIARLDVKIEEKPILHGINLTIKQGEIHALMGPNGSGKSTLGNSLMGHPGYEIIGGDIKINDQIITECTPNERAQAGLFLAFQHPLTIPGVPLMNFLKAAHDQLYPEKKKSALELFNHVKDQAKRLNIPEDFLRRPINDGLSGGERKKIETLQILILNPKFIILDELDTGTDVDTLRQIGETVDSLHQHKATAPGILMITHYNRIFRYIQPNFVHIIKNGQIVKSAGPELVEQIEKDGYEQFK